MKSSWGKVLFRAPKKAIAKRALLHTEHTRNAYFRFPKGEQKFIFMTISSIILLYEFQANITQTL